eukprot:GILI01003465.1.p1 GENE.GILI01003465.1~~GILI01003465.1.p1  ORF type:complete len:958 (+),score=364.49 GILI01003465.1:200-3073(+)
MSSNLVWPVNRVRQQFVDFFVEKQGHKFVQSSPVIPHNDPTLLFINAGMNQFKGLFLGTADPNTEFGQLKRAANSQICIRAGGKHNDLEDVGRDTYHHTFFEMLGNWSFADYFKEESIAWAWELLTEVYGLPKERLYVTYFEGDEKNGLKPDLESMEIWKKYVPEDRIIRGNAKDNFWEMGDTGPCGPCTEIHFDRLGGRNAADLVNKDDPMVIEIWNIVFMQYDRQSDRSLKSLPGKHVDTGMGLERITSILQNVYSNYDTDAWTPIFDAIQKITKFPEAYNKDKPNTDDVTIAYRVIADHARCLTVALADGAVPDSVGRGFVLRRIIRRAIRYGSQFLNAETGFFTQLVDVVCESLGSFFPHLKDAKVIARVKAILTDEEESFAKTWKIGLKHFETARDAAIKSNSTTISGSEAFILHDRYGFPVDLTSLLAEKENMKVDIDAFNNEMKTNQVSGGRVAAAKTFIDTHQIDELKKLGTPSTKDYAKYNWEVAAGTALQIFDKTSEKFVKETSSTAAESIGLILDQTNFYAEAGGQIYDTGVIHFSNGAKFQVDKVYSFAGYVVHIGQVVSGTVKINEEAKLEVDFARRLPIAANHTATHQLNLCLRRALEDEKPEGFMEVNQKGSLVNEEMLRFDFSYNTKLTVEEVAKVEKYLNEAIERDLKVYSKECALADAKAINGLRQMFGEKYPDPVSVVCVGVPVEDLLANPTNPEWRNYSIEFCGGTHLKSLNEIKHAVVVSEDALMKGVRRIVIYTRGGAQKAIAEATILENDYKTILNSAEPVDDKTKALSVLNKKAGDATIPLITKHQLRDAIDASIKQLVNEAKQAAAEAKTKATAYGAEVAASIAPTCKSYVAQLDQFGADREALQALADGIIAARSDVGVYIIGVDAPKDKALVICTLPKSLVDQKLSAVEWIKASVGKGGGKPNAAQGGIAPKDAEAVLAKAKEAAVKYGL